ncbi:unnamed protein product, partial [Amoebophrya sp. A25]
SKHHEVHLALLFQEFDLVYNARIPVHAILKMLSVGNRIRGYLLTLLRRIYLVAQYTSWLDKFLKWISWLDAVFFHPLAEKIHKATRGRKGFFFRVEEVDEDGKLTGTQIAYPLLSEDFWLRYTSTSEDQSEQLSAAQKQELLQMSIEDTELFSFGETLTGRSPELKDLWETTFRQKAAAVLARGQAAGEEEVPEPEQEPDLEPRTLRIPGSGFVGNLVVGVTSRVSGAIRTGKRLFEYADAAYLSGRFTEVGRRGSEFGRRLRQLVGDHRTLSEGERNQKTPEAKRKYQQLLAKYGALGDEGVSGDSDIGACASNTEDAGETTSGVETTPGVETARVETGVESAGTGVGTSDFAGDASG